MNAYDINAFVAIGRDEHLKGANQPNFEPQVQNDSKRSLSHLFPVEVTEKPAEYLVKVMVPGIDPEQIKVESSARELMISAETQPRELNKDENVHMSEFHYGQFSRHLTFPLPETENI